MPSVLFLTESLRLASTRYRAVGYFPFLEAANWQVRHVVLGKDISSRLAALRQARQVDVVVAVRKLFNPFYRNLLRRASRRLVLDFDDAINVNDDGSVSAIRARRFKQMVGVCDEVWAGNDYLADQARRFNSSIHLLPTSIDMSNYHVSSTAPKEGLEVVWIGSSSTRKYLEESLPTLGAAAARIKGLTLTVLADFTLGPNVFNIKSIPWSEDAQARELARCHVGIAPLPDNAWTRGKCGLKVLQYMAAGLPVVASNCGVHPQLIEPGQSGFLCAAEQQWMDALQTLAHDADLCRRLGERGREIVSQHYDRSILARLMIAALEQRLNPAPLK